MNLILAVFVARIILSMKQDFPASQRDFAQQQTNSYVKTSSYLTWVVELVGFYRNFRKAIETVIKESQYSCRSRISAFRCVCFKVGKLNTPCGKHNEAQKLCRYLKLDIYSFLICVLRKDKVCYLFSFVCHETLLKCIRPYVRIGPFRLGKIDINTYKNANNQPKPHFDIIL